MREFWSRRARELTPYVPGEQPQGRTFIKLNTNESPYPPAPAALEAIRAAADGALRLYPDPDCRGVFFGLSAIHTRAHMLRAVMEGVSYSLCDCNDILKEIGVHVSQMMACGGGGRSPVWRQMLADLYDCQVKTVHQSEGPALGADHQHDPEWPRDHGVFDPQ